MTYQILNTISGKFVKNAIDRKVHQFETEELAQRFADSHRSNLLQDAAYRPSPSRKFSFKVEMVA